MSLLRIWINDLGREDKFKCSARARAVAAATAALRAERKVTADQLIAVVIPRSRHQATAGAKLTSQSYQLEDNVRFAVRSHTVFCVRHRCANIRTHTRAHRYASMTRHCCKAARAETHDDDDDYASWTRANINRAVSAVKAESRVATFATATHRYYASERTKAQRPVCGDFFSPLLFLFPLDELVSL